MRQPSRSLSSSIVWKRRGERERSSSSRFFTTFPRRSSFSITEGLRFINSAARDIANLEEKNSSDLTPERLFPLLTTAGYPLSDYPA